MGLVYGYFQIMKEFLRKWKKYFVCAAMLSCLINLLQLTFSFYMFAIYDTIVASYSERALYSITVIALFSLVHLAVFSNLRSKLLRTAGNDLDKRLGPDILHYMIKGSSGPVKRTYQQGVADLAILRGYFNNRALYALFDAPFAPFYLILIFFFHPGMGLLATGGCLVAIGLNVLQDHLTRKRLIQANIESSQNRRFLDTMLRNAEVVNAMGMGRNIYHRFEKRNTASVLNQTIASRYAGLSQSTIKAVQSLMNVLIYGLGAFYVLNDGLDPGIMIASSMIMSQALGPLMQALYAAKTTIQAREAYRRIHQFSLLIERQPQQMTLPAPRGRFQAEHLFFGLGGRILLRDLSFNLEPGDFLGLIGPNGAGKTTLSRILLGVWPSAVGKLRLDGVDIFTWDQEELGRYIGYLPQEIELFPATLAENIARLQKVDMEKVHRAARAAGVDEFVDTLPDGYDTMVSAHEGVMLSGGQKQRVGFARALYGEPRILILDEPNSNLDEQGESALARTLGRLQKEGRTTCIIITHSYALLNVVNKILLLKDGCVAMFGPKKDVLEKIAGQKTQSAQQERSAS